MIRIKNLTKKYGDSTILENAEYTLPDKGLVCLLGASGCGKSTLLNLIAGFDSSFSGTIEVDGLSLGSLSPEELCVYRQRKIGFIFQNYHLLKGYSVLENILLPCELSDTDSCTNYENAEKLLDSLGIIDKKMQNAENLSGGQKQRVAIARALMNNPEIILADEPTGALDRSTSSEIMTLLKEISKERLVVVITHDNKICDFADEILTINDRKIICQNSNISPADENVPCGTKELPENKTKISAFKRGLKNFRVHIKRYLAIGIAISVSIFCFVSSLSFGNIIDKSISDFKEKNTAFNNGYIKIDDKNTEDIFSLLAGDERLENVYKQYVIKDVTLKSGDSTNTMDEKYPMAKAKYGMSYGIMPRTGKNEIALSPTLAKKFAAGINELIGKELELEYNGTTYALTISGIFNGEYDDFFVSSDIEQKLYSGLNDTPYSVTYDVKNFDDILSINKLLSDKEITTIDASTQVKNLKTTFDSLSRLFLIVSILILFVGLFISSILLVKQQNSRYREIGLLSALGFNKKSISGMIKSENILLAVLSTVLNTALILAAVIISSIFSFPFALTGLQILISVAATFAIILTISFIASRRLINTEPASALIK